MVGSEDATGVVRTLSGTAVGYVGADGGIIGLPTAADGGGPAATACAGWQLDQSVCALLGGSGRVLGTAPARSDSGAAGPGEVWHGVAAGAAAAGLEVVEGVREELGLLWAEDGQVVGSCVTRVAAGMAVVSTSGKVLGDVGQDGTVFGKTGVPPRRSHRGSRSSDSASVALLCVNPAHLLVSFVWLLACPSIV